MSDPLSYKQHLFNKKWKEKRNEILIRDQHKCRICGSTDNLTVHHTQYHITPDGKKYLPWMYDNKYLITLCEKCHAKGHRLFNIPVKVLPLPLKSLFD